MRWPSRPLRLHLSLHPLFTPPHNYRAAEMNSLSSTARRQDSMRCIRVSDSHAHLIPPSLPSGSPSANEEKTSLSSCDRCCCACDGSQEQTPFSAHDAPRGVESEHVGGEICLSHLVLCGTHPSLDWEAIAAVDMSSTFSPIASHTTECGGKEVEKNNSTTTTTTVLIGFGIHPWYAPELSENVQTTPKTAITENRNREEDFNRYRAEDLLAQLEEKLRQFPRAIVGEIGLDKLRGPSPAAQEALFLAQVRLAAKYQRPVSLHCIRRYGPLLELLDKKLVYKEEVPPAIILHGFTGSAAVAQSLLKMKHKKLSDPALSKSAAAPISPVTSLSPSVDAVSKGAARDDENNNNNTDNNDNNMKSPSRMETKGTGAQTEVENAANEGDAIKTAKSASADIAENRTTLQAAVEATTTAGHKKNNSRGRSAKDVVKISERIYFGVGQSTTLTVKDSLNATLPLLLARRRVLAESDRFYNSTFCSFPSLRPVETENQENETADGALLQQKEETRKKKKNNNDDDGGDAEKTSEHHEMEKALLPVLQAVANASSASLVEQNNDNNSGNKTSSESNNQDALLSASDLLEESFLSAFASVLDKHDA